MARTNGPYGPSGAALRRRPGDDPYGAPAGPQAGQWGSQPHGYGDPAPHPQTMQQGYHFPPPDPEPPYGYGNQQLMPAQQQWGQPQPDPRGYELAYQTYAPADPGPFSPPAQHAQQGYGGEAEPDYSEEYYDDEEPRRGKRWFLIAVALVGAIGVGGALAYGYRSFVAPHSGRVPVVKADPNVKAKPDFRGGKEFAGTERKPSARTSEEAPAQREGAPEAAEEPAAENLGPRVVKSIPIAPGGVAGAPEPPAAVPGITLYRPPQLPAQPAAAAATPPPASQAQPAPKTVQAPAPAPPGRVVIGNRPQPAAEPDEEASAAPPPVRRSVPVQTAAVTPKAASAAKPREASSGLGYVAVLSSKKTSMEALQAFADMQQQYPEVLSGKTPDVQTADLSARNLGTMYRLVVGPPGSHNAARNVCNQLKAAGYEGCWVKEF